MSVSDNASGSPQLVGLNGTGVDFSVGVNPGSATIEHGQSTNFNVTVNPVGGTFNSVLSLSCSATEPIGMRLLPGRCDLPHSRRNVDCYNLHVRKNTAWHLQCRDHGYIGQ